MTTHTLKTIELFTDGACLGNPGPGGWGVISKHGDTITELSGGEAHTTNNRMELTAVIEGLSALEGRCDVTVYTDSKYIVNAMTAGWLRNWKRNGWRTAAGGPVKNKELWERLLQLGERHIITYKWIKGHAGNLYNEKCDTLATSQARMRATNCKEGKRSNEKSA